MQDDACFEYDNYDEGDKEDDKASVQEKENREPCANCSGAVPREKSKYGIFSTGGFCIEQERIIVLMIIVCVVAAGSKTIRRVRRKLSHEELELYEAELIAQCNAFSYPSLAMHLVSYTRLFRCDAAGALECKSLMDNVISSPPSIRNRSRSL